MGNYPKVDFHPQFRVAISDTRSTQKRRLCVRLQHDTLFATGGLWKGKNAPAARQGTKDGTHLSFAGGKAFAPYRADACIGHGALAAAFGC
ncbi:hypothetical protein AGR8A_Lc10473 [Agrobacterium fabrum str. J-07]|nr:hypothetical protein AGR8A_Lc10473 [Agrobacterium fabrum str. J-07]